jgi:hypothetical protein
MGYSVHDTIIKAGAVLEMEYKHHLETVYCIEGEGRSPTWPSGHHAPDRSGHAVRARTSTTAMSCAPAKAPHAHGLRIQSTAYRT